MIVGIVGHEAAKFTLNTLAMAKEIITRILEPDGVVLSSGRCHLGGIDIWAEEIAEQLGHYNPDLIFPPKNHSWAAGYKPRNIQIAEASDIVHVIVVEAYPERYTGRRFVDDKTNKPYCYHCKTDTHVKSGGCWTARYALANGKLARWHTISEAIKS